MSTITHKCPHCNESMIINLSWLEMRMLQCMHCHGNIYYNFITHRFYSSKDRDIDIKQEQIDIDNGKYEKEWD